MSHRDLFVILEDDGRRRGAMEHSMENHGIDLSVQFFGSAPECINFLDRNLPRVRVISLDCDLDSPTDGNGEALPLSEDPQSGVEVVDFLVSQPERVPVVIHSGNQTKPEFMEASLKEAGFPRVERVWPYGNNLVWVRAWAALLKEMIETEIAKESAGRLTGG